MYRRLILIASMSVSLAACVPYSDGGGSYYSSEVYSSPAYYYGGGTYNAYPRNDYPSARYYQPAPRYYPSAPRYYQPAPRYYQAPPRAAYRPYPNQGWSGHQSSGWGHTYGNQRRDGDERGGRDHGGRHGDHDGRGDRGSRNR
ncbi:hypothetical protein SAMN04487857_101440 [Pseudomonas sp. ok272]|uniref:hypothetical protein n=1 Tax=unclassified Pseudomonas TaxID=196821 RepID=UPI0008CFC5B9|nr:MULTISPECIES: hypothetical protein [unclassified Pseudomonas]SEM37861.1 hypothetical protein SAMN04487857_101440 [Pseudomonas sp. ok272]SFM38301.1 hypothetical protein SAMN04487858_102442 [Pseudomonas sp. ok602]